MPTLQAHALIELARQIFTAAGATPANAEGVVSSLVGANLAGHDSHGVMRIPAYVRDIRAGRLDPGASPFIAHETATVALVDGAGTFGQVGSAFAAELAAAKARASGVAVVAAQHCHHTGRIGEWVERIAAHGLIGMAANSSPRGPHQVAPYGGIKGALGTNPIAWGIPRAAGQPPIVLDYATSVIAQGKLQVARVKGEPVPPGTILNSAGQPTTNVEDFFGGGLLLPFAGHKGYAMSVIVELLAVGLSAGEQVRPPEPGACLQVLAIDPSALRPAEEFTAYVEAVANRLKATPPASGSTEVLLPGEPEARTRGQRSRDGIPVPERTWSAILATAEELSVAAARG